MIHYGEVIRLSILSHEVFFVAVVVIGKGIRRTKIGTVEIQNLEVPFYDWAVNTSNPCD